MRNPEKFQTNFNSIVNSKVKLNKIFLEVSIPKSFLSSNDYLTRIDDKIEEDEKEIPDIQLDKFNIYDVTTIIMDQLITNGPVMTSILIYEDLDNLRFNNATLIKTRIFKNNENDVVFDCKNIPFSVNIITLAIQYIYISYK